MRTYAHVDDRGGNRGSGDDQMGIPGGDPDGHSPQHLLDRAEFSSREADEALKHPTDACSARPPSIVQNPIPINSAAAIAMFFHPWFGRFRGGVRNGRNR